MLMIDSTKTETLLQLVCTTKKKKTTLFSDYPHSHLQSKSDTIVTTVNCIPLYAAEVQLSSPSQLKYLSILRVYWDKLNKKKLDICNANTQIAT